MSYIMQVLWFCPFPCAVSLNEISKVENADPTAILSVQFSPEGSKIVSGGYSGMIKVWDAGTPNCPNRLCCQN